MAKVDKKNQDPNSDYVMADVLYQRLGAQWFAFTEKDGEVFMGAVDADSVSEYDAEEEIMAEAMEFISEIENKKLGPELI